MSTQTCGTHPRLFDKSPSEMFWEFHRRNPEIYRRLRSMARQAKASGKDKYSMRAIWEVLRWRMNVQSTDVHQTLFRLNDHYPPYYARLLMQQEPDLEGFFETRERR